MINCAIQKNEYNKLDKVIKFFNDYTKRMNPNKITS